MTNDNICQNVQPKICNLQFFKRSGPPAGGAGGPGGSTDLKIWKEIGWEKPRRTSSTTNPG